MTKDDFLKTLSEEGYKVSFQNGIPTAFIEPAADINKTAKAITKHAKEKGYDQSFGIAYQKKEIA